MTDNIVSQLRLLANSPTPRVESELMVQAADEIVRLEAELLKALHERDEAKERNVRLLSRLQEYEVREL